MLGVYDSGVGGLTVVKEIRRLMPTASITYVGDTARAPYGGKDAQTLFEHGCEVIRFLLKKGAKIIVVACGTSSSVSIDALRREFPSVPLVDTIRPAVKTTLELARQSADFRPVFIATEGTVKSGLFARLFREGAPDCELHVRACPLFAPIVESGLTTVKNHPLVNFAAEHYLADLRGKVNALILGCTHYPLLTDALARTLVSHPAKKRSCHEDFLPQSCVSPSSLVFGQASSAHSLSCDKNPPNSTFSQDETLGEITFINPAEATARAAKKLLPPPENATPKIRCYATGDPKSFSKIAKFILGEKCTARKAEI